MLQKEEKVYVSNLRKKKIKICQNVKHKVQVNGLVANWETLGLKGRHL